MYLAQRRGHAHAVQEVALDEEALVRVDERGPQWRVCYPAPKP